MPYNSLKVHSDNLTLLVVHSVTNKDYFLDKVHHNWSKDNSNLPDVKGSLSICIARCFATSARGVLPRSDAK